MSGRDSYYWAKLIGPLMTLPWHDVCHQHWRTEIFLGILLLKRVGFQVGSYSHDHRHHHHRHLECVGNYLWASVYCWMRHLKFHKNYDLFNALKAELLRNLLWFLKIAARPPHKIISTCTKIYTNTVTILKEITTTTTATARARSRRGTERSTRSKLVSSYGCCRRDNGDEGRSAVRC